MVWNQETVTRRSVQAEVDQGLRQYMLKVYNYMTSGLVLTGVVAMLTLQSPMLLNAILGSGLMWVLFIAQIGLVFFLSARIGKIQASTAQMVFWIYAALMGLTFSVILVAYTGESVARVFFITAATFSSMSIYGYVTKRDLSAFRSFLYMGLIGVILASVVNIFLHSSALQFALSVAGVLVFTGLTAYDTQKIKEMYYESDGEELSKKKAIMGALSLYLDFINLFIMLLSLFGNRR